MGNNGGFDPNSAVLRILQFYTDHLCLYISFHEMDFSIPRPCGVSKLQGLNWRHSSLTPESNRNLWW